MKGFYETAADANDYMFVHYFDSTSIGAHFHKSLEIVYCVEGCTTFFIGGETFTLNADEIYIVPSYTIHFNKNKGNNKILSFVFAHNFFHDFEKTFPDKIFSPVLKNHEENKKLLTKLNAIHETYWQNQMKIPFLKAQAMINDLLYEMSLIYPLIPLQHKKIDYTVLDILTYINEHYTENFTLEELAERYNYCPQYFSGLFNKTVGCNLNTYINNIRIEKALQEIENPKTNKTITQIAFDNGFKSLSTFYRILQEKRNGPRF